MTPVVILHFHGSTYIPRLCNYSSVTHQQLIHKLVMASIFSLTDDCLLRILSFFDDPYVFHCFILTCQRFYHVSKNANSVLHLELLKSKAENYVKRYVVDEANSYDKYCCLVDLLRRLSHLSTSKRLLTNDKVVDAWQRSGPVVAKLLTWLRSTESSREEGEPRATCYKERGKFTLQLPSCAKKMAIETSHFGDYGHNYDRELTIRVSCEDLNAKSERFSRDHPEDYMYMTEKAVNGVARSMKGVIEVLQKELGDTVPPINGRFFIWFCFCFPNGSPLDEEQRLRFKDESRNTKPTTTSVMSAIHQFHKNLESENTMQKLLSEWEAGEQRDSTYCKPLVETFHLLALRSEAEIFDALQKDAQQFYNIANDYSFEKLPKQLLLQLILRTSLVTSDYNAGSIADKYVQSKIQFKCIGGNSIQVFGGMRGDGASYPTWYEIDLEFTLPDGKVIKLEAEEKPLEIEKLSPVTELVKKSISQGIPQELIPKIGNLLIAVYFLAALGFGAEEQFIETYNKPLLSESEEESE